MGLSQIAYGLQGSYSRGEATETSDIAKTPRNLANSPLANFILGKIICKLDNVFRVDLE